MRFKLDLDMEDGTNREWRQSSKRRFFEAETMKEDIDWTRMYNDIAVFGSSTVTIDPTITARYNRVIRTLGE